MNTSAKDNLKKKQKKSDNDDKDSSAEGFQKLMDDMDFFLEMLSFCDFSTLIKLRSTCRKIQRYADRALNQAAKRTFDSLPIKSEDTDYNDVHCVTMALHKGWAKGYTTRDCLIEGALETVHFYLEDNDHLRPLARSLLQRNGRVGSFDFLGEYVEGQDYSFQADWEVSIKHIIFENANKWLDNRHFVINDISKWLREEEGEDLFTSGKALLVWHSALALIHAADPSSFRFARLKYDNRHDEYPSGGADWYLMFRTRDNKRVEFSYHVFNETT